jgi:ribosome-associated protein
VKSGLPPDAPLPPQSIEFVLSRSHVELCQLLKLAGIAASGGGGKRIVAAGEVSVDGQPESRKTAKIHSGQSVQCRGFTILVKAP